MPPIMTTLLGSRDGLTPPSLPTSLPPPCLHCTEIISVSLVIAMVEVKASDR